MKNVFTTFIVYVMVTTISHLILNISVHRSFTTKTILGTEKRGSLKRKHSKSNTGLNTCLELKVDVVHSGLVFILSDLNSGTLLYIYGTKGMAYMVCEKETCQEITKQKAKVMYDDFL